MSRAFNQLSNQNKLCVFCIYTLTLSFLWHQHTHFFVFETIHSPSFSLKLYTITTANMDNKRIERKPKDEPKTIDVQLSTKSSGETKASKSAGSVISSANPLSRKKKSKISKKQTSKSPREETLTLEKRDRYHRTILVKLECFCLLDSEIVFFRSRFKFLAVCYVFLLIH
jgi:hypothetical protein